WRARGGPSVRPVRAGRLTAHRTPRRRLGRGERRGDPGDAGPRVRTRGGVRRRRPQPSAGRSGRVGVRDRAPQAHPRGAIPRDHSKDARGGGSGMNELSVRATTPAPGHRPAPRPMSRLSGLPARLVGAEFLKLRTRRGLVAMSALLTVGVVVVTYAVLLILH